MAVIIGEGGPGDKNSLDLTTCERTRIDNVRRMEAPPDRRNAIYKHLRETHPNAEIRSVSQCYNCMGMVFASRRTAIDIDQIQLILDEDKFSKLAKIDDAKVGDIV